MANGKQANAKRMKMSERAAHQMNIHFPGFPEAWVWRRKTNDGFTTVPRTMPIVMQAVDAQSKGQPAGHALFCLWARSPDHPLITIENPATFASEAGFAGERAVDTWRKRMKRLRDLGFIRTKQGSSGDYHYVLLVNPNAVMEWMYTQKLIQDGLYSRFVERLIDVGGFGEIEAVRAYWAAQNQATAAAQAAEATSGVAEASTKPIPVAPKVPKPPKAPNPPKLPVPPAATVPPNKPAARKRVRLND
jgi:hypothetical protein